MFTLSSLQSEVKHCVIVESFQLWFKQPLITPLADYRNNSIENADFFELYFSTHTVSGMLQQTQHPASLSLFSFIQRLIVGHVSQIRFYIPVENQVSVAYQVMGEQVVQL